MDEVSPKDSSIFYAVLAVTGREDRRQLLDSLCAGDQKLRRQVEKLLAAHEDDSALKQLAAEAADLGEKMEDTRVGQTIGRYKLREKIGEGGFGLVYMADQLEPIQRRVALKVIKAGMDTQQVIARFEAERQALDVFNQLITVYAYSIFNFSSFFRFLRALPTNHNSITPITRNCPMVVTTIKYGS